MKSFGLLQVFGQWLDERGWQDGDAILVALAIPDNDLARGFGGGGGAFEIRNGKAAEIK